MTEGPLPWINQVSLRLLACTLPASSGVVVGDTLILLSMWALLSFLGSQKNQTLWEKGKWEERATCRGFLSPAPSWGLFLSPVLSGTIASPLNLRGKESNPGTNEPSATGSLSFLPVPVLLDNIETNFNVLTTPWIYLSGLTMDQTL